MKMKIKGSGNRAWQPQTGKEIIKRETEERGCHCLGASESESPFVSGCLWAANQIKLSDNRVNSAKQLQFAASRGWNFTLIFGTQTQDTHSSHISMNGSMKRNGWRKK